MFSFDTHPRPEMAREGGGLSQATLGDEVLIVMAWPLGSRAMFQCMGEPNNQLGNFSHPGCLDVQHAGISESNFCSSPKP